MVVGQSLWRAKSKLAFPATALGVGAGAATIAKSEDPATSLKLCTTVPVRFFRLSLAAATIAFGILGTSRYINTSTELMLNRYPISSYDQVLQVVKKELGGAPQEIFDEFDPVPIASASLTQVHVAHARRGEKVAMKVQHTHMTDTAALDYATVELIVNTLHRLFPSFDYRLCLCPCGILEPKYPKFVDHGVHERCTSERFKQHPKTWNGTS